MKSIGRPFSRFIKGRPYSAHAAAQTKGHEKSGLTPRDPKVTALGSGATLVSLETCSPLSSISIIFNVGPRHETVSEIGLTHRLRVAASLSNKHSSAFGVARNLQQIGSTFTCTTTREQTIYTAHCLRSQFDTSLDYLQQMALAPAFKDWEVRDNNKQCEIDLKVYEASLHARLMDAVHLAAFRDTLGRSLYMKPHQAGSFTPEDLRSFVEKYYTANNAIIVGVGVDDTHLSFTARKTMSMNQGAPPPHAAAKYHGGGEVRIDAPGPLTHAAVVMEGVALSSADAAVVHVLQQAIGPAPTIHHGANGLSKLHTAASGITTAPFSAQCFGASYSDSGLFGIQVVAGSHDVGKVLRASLNAVSNAVKSGFTDAEVQSAKARAKAQLQFTAEDQSGLVELIASQMLHTPQPLSAGQLTAVIDKVTTANVNRVAKSLTSGKPSIAAVGNLEYMPYLDELI